MNPVSTGNTEHYQWGNNCDGWHLVKTPGLSVIEERMPPGTSEVRHYHTTSQQFFYVLSGAATLEIENRVVTLSPGEGLHVLPESTHVLSNRSDDDLRFLVVSQPPAHGDRVTLR